MVIRRPFPMAVLVMIFAPALFVASTGAVRAEGALSSLAAQSSLTDTPDGPKEQLRGFGISPDVSVTRFYQGQPTGDASKTWFYGGKVDAFLKLYPEKLGQWPSFHVNAQYEHYFGDDINRRDYALLPVNTAQAYVNPQGYHSALSVSVTQDFGEHVSVSAGKFNTLTLAAQTPLIGGGGVDTFMNRAFALPSTGVGYTAPRGGAADRVVVSAPYLIGGAVTLKTEAAILTLAVVDPRSAQSPQVIEHPFEKGVAVGGSTTIPTEIAGLHGYHTFRAAYSDARGVDLDDNVGPRMPATASAVTTRKGYWFSSYAVHQNLFQSAEKPSVGWGLFGLGTLSDGNPNPVKWSMVAGLAGNNLIDGRENDRWGVGFFHYGLTQPLLSALAALDVRRRGEGGVETFYNFAITRWLRLSADLQLIDPWNPARNRETYMALRLQTKF